MNDRTTNNPPVSFAMMLRSAVVTLSFAIATTAQAQGGGCVIETDNPPELKGARLMIAKIADDNPTTSRVSEKPSHFRIQLENLTNKTATIQNQIGRQYLLGRLYSIWLFINLPGTKSITTRGDLKMLGNPKAPHDLYMAMDSAFTKVEQMNPACIDSTSKYRGAVSQMAYNEARVQLEAKAYDSAVVLAKRALVADPKGAGPWNILAEANRQRGDSAGYREALRKVAESVTGSDPQMKRVKSQAMYNLAIMTLTDAQNAKDEATKKRLAEQAESDLREFLKLNPGDATGSTALGRALMIKGDSSAAKGLLDEMVKNPEKYSAAALFEGAGGQFAGGEFATANKLYEAGLARNPMFRDALFSYVSSLLKAEQSDKALEVVRKLLSVDPNSQSTLTQAAAVWSAIYRAADEASKAKVQDSLIHYTTESRQASAYVRVNAFTPSATGAKIEGQVNNMTDAPKSYTIEFEFLNATGGVVSTATGSAPDAPAKTGKAFTVSGTGAGIVAWRYKPIK